MAWYQDPDEDLEMLPDDLELELEKGEDNDCSISEGESELNYNYIVIFNTKTKAIAKESKIFARYKDDFEFDIQLKI